MGFDASEAYSIVAHANLVQSLPLAQPRAAEKPELASLQLLRKKIQFKCFKWFKGLNTMMLLFICALCGLLSAATAFVLPHPQLARLQSSIRKSVVQCKHAAGDSTVPNLRDAVLEKLEQVS
jgi:hypothetical protein